jgi:hypothetical protein
LYLAIILGYDKKKHARQDVDALSVLRAFAGAPNASRRPSGDSEPQTVVSPPGIALLVLSVFANPGAALTP